MQPRTLTDSTEAFRQIVASFVGQDQVSCENSHGFGSGALKVKNKIFAMISSRGEFVLKLPKERIAELIAKGSGQYFSAGRGRPMKEWIVVTAAQTQWGDLANEAHQFVRGKS